MARNTLKFDGDLFGEYIRQLESLGADVKQAVEDTLVSAGETIGDDTMDAVQDKYLPAKGKYSGIDKDTQKSIIRNPEVKWIGETAEMGVGFDYSKPGAGGYLITGSPKRPPDQELKRMYKGKRYMKQIQEQITEDMENAVEEHMGG